MGTSASIPPLPSIFAIGEILNDTYEIRSVLGQGGMGQVYEAHDQVLNRRVAIKVAWPDLEDSPLRKEAQALAHVRHPGMVTVYTMGMHRQMEYVVMERVYGVSLEAHIARRKAHDEAFSATETIALLRQIAEPLSAVHRAGIAHRDIKPSNVMLAPGNRVVLMDFGLFVPEFEVADQEMIAGSPQYMAPEAIANGVEPGAGHLVDLYALGVLGYELLAGEVPFPGDQPKEVWYKHLHAPVPSLLKRRNDVPKRLAALIHELLAKDASERPQSIETVLWQLGALEDDNAIEDRPLALLLVDDDVVALRTLALHVRRVVPDAEIYTAGDGDAAIELFRRHTPDVMFLDLELPGLNGIEVCMYIRGMEGAASCTIVPVSANVQEHDRALLLQLGITHFIRKGSTMARKVSELLKQVRRRGSLRPPR